MSSIAEETDSQLLLLMAAYKRLQQAFPDHELLRFAELQEDGKGVVFSEEYHDQYVETDDEYRIQGMIRYTSELEKAFKEGTSYLCASVPPYIGHRTPGATPRDSKTVRCYWRGRPFQEGDEVGSEMKVTEEEIVIFLFAQESSQ